MTTNPTPDRYRRTEEVEAVQWTGRNADTLRAFAGHHFDTIDPEDRLEDGDQDAQVLIEASYWTGISPGYWVLHFEDHFDVERDENFRAAWEPAAASAAVAVAVPPTGQTALVEVAAQAIRDSNGTPEALEWWRTHPQLIPAHVYAAAVLAVLPPPADRAAVLREAADFYERVLSESLDPNSDPRYCTAVRDMVMGLRRRADETAAAETQPGPEAEDPARIDRIRPEFTEHASVESIDAQLRRARAQERRWHLRTEWLISLRSARVEQKARGEWPADGRCAACGHSVCDGEGPCGARSGDDFCTCPGPPAVVSAVPPQPEETA
ncbi:hypothetical protein M2155_000644 [Streptomyces sp. SAI-119]|uniref:hypothetical protein n=1 Tax=Streptomyces sp. SAI-119 TaxID=2940541 RepID=UPI0024760A94|nr:hypothetical protein [Streptomyces sp. SAI-119]MDH6448236.1 hypothetical protein [Streptomyces sp. SAI-119]